MRNGRAYRAGTLAVTTKTKEINPVSHGADSIIGCLSMHEYYMKNVTFKFQVTTTTFTAVVIVNVPLKL